MSALWCKLQSKDFSIADAPFFILIFVFRSASQGYAVSFIFMFPQVGWIHGIIGYVSRIVANLLLLFEEIVPWYSLYPKLLIDSVPINETIKSLIALKPFIWTLKINQGKPYEIFLPAIILGIKVRALFFENNLC